MSGTVPIIKVDKINWTQRGEDARCDFMESLLFLIGLDFSYYGLCKPSY
jgi:hypothetical protein